ncbi:MAG: S26 family signal peptidase [Victivallaceae bacterium]|nr:S26 family signal peptidase [Victivallaceae bacterium]
MENMHYTGVSMLGVFAPGDDLSAEAVEYGAAEVGDVIVFSDPANPKKLFVHRVITVAPAGLRTQGDNNALPDPFTLPPDTRILRVVSRRRGSAESAVTRGKAGRREFRRNQRRVRLRLLWRRALRRPARLALLRRFAPSPRQLEKKQFRRDGRLFKSLLYRGNSVVASYDFDAARWVVCGKWKLFYSARSLAAIKP